MGACDFWTISRGTNASEAFRSAVEFAEFEHGHGGYSGTIAEKDGFNDLTGRFKVFDIWQMFKSAIAKLKAEKKAAEKEAKKPFPKGQWVVRDSPEMLGNEIKWLERSYKRFREAEKKTADQKARAMSDALLALGFGDDKWGPAMCLKVKPGLYLFFGMASE